MSITLWERGADELNIAQLSLISIQMRLPDSFQEWEDTFTVAGRPVMVQATAGKLGLPHGIDVDTNAALINLLFEQGCPADNAVRVSSYELLQGMGLDDSGTNYALLNESVQRMLLASYTIQG
ncbi:replication initiator protein A (plasmid) [Deinococcus sp. KNUC1210]|uniref:replication initiator protein A n=1 Tax=Deinococcus sp. KNUC1210 TaxID=2917691 RepID=UPI001EF1541A|nr:replication initiator protein A [Deinococcus sp. KNUC1210]ULH18161.1 replication initiator protein A [Deinococcus sp. KNUC1210]